MSNVNELDNDIDLEVTNIIGVDNSMIVDQQRQEDDSSNSSNENDIQLTSGSSSIKIDIKSLSQIKKNQLKRLRKLIKLTHAYSIHYYSYARFWKWIFWITSIGGVILSSISTIVNIFFDPCSSKESVQKYNVLVSAIITMFIGLGSLLGAQLRQRNYEDAGDKYKMLAQDIYREVFFSNLSYDDIDLSYLIEKYNIKFDGYLEMFREPSSNKLQEIMDSSEYGLGIKFII